MSRPLSHPTPLPGPSSTTVGAHRPATGGVWAFALLSAAGAVAAGLHPTASRASDVVLAALLGCGGGRSGPRRWGRRGRWPPRSPSWGRPVSGWRWRRRVSPSRSSGCDARRGEPGAGSRGRHDRGAGRPPPARGPVRRQPRRVGPRRWAASCSHVGALRRTRPRSRLQRLLRGVGVVVALSSSRSASRLLCPA